MTKHAIIKELVRIERTLLKAKEFSGHGECDRLICEAIAKLVEVGQKMYPDLVKLKSKYADPTM
jgi:hypothetical protein